MAQKTVTIGGTTFHLRTFSPFEQLKMFGDLQRELLPALGILMSAGDGVAKKDDDMDIAAALSRLSGSLDGGKLAAWSQRLLTEDTISFTSNASSGKEAQKLKPGLFDLAFNDFSEIVELMGEVIVLNFAGPLGRWLGRIGSGREALGKLLDDSPKS
jgi:hypothetical protein